MAFEILAGMGRITPVLGAVLHMLAASFVIFNSARLVRFGEEMHRVEAPQGPADTAHLEPVAVTQ